MNTLKFKISFSLFLVALIPLVFYILLNGFVVTKVFSKIESSSMESAIKKVQDIFAVSSEYVLQNVRDYAIWDETYERIQLKDITWFQENFSNWIPKNMNIDLIIVSNHNNEIVNSFGCTSKMYSDLLEAEFAKKLLQYDINNDPESYPHGFYVCNDEKELYIIAASPILQNNYIGTSQGIIIFGKKVTPNFLECIKQDYKYDIFFSLEGNIISASDIYEKAVSYYETYNKRFAKNQIQSIFKSDNNHDIIGIVPIQDISGEMAVNMFIVESREVFIYTLNIMILNAVLIFVVALLLIFFLSRKAHKLIVYLINKLLKSKDIQELEPVFLESANEIKELVMVFNKISKKLEKQKWENKSLKSLSITDHLTSLYNHSYCFEYLEKKVLTNCYPLTVIFCDIDHFKLINDMQGHITGDMVLAEVGKVIKNCIQNHDHITACRYGGEEFVIILEKYTKEQAYEIAEIIREQVSKSNILAKYSSLSSVTISIGIASCPSDASNASDLIEKADRAMYHAKRRGRNQSVIYTPALEEKDLAIDIAEQATLTTNAMHSLTAVIDAKDSYVERHSEMVATYSLELARKINLSEKDQTILKMGGLLHDCGKIGIPDDIIKKSTQLTKEEWDRIKVHPQIGTNIIKHIVTIPEIQVCIQYHHERWDGTGCPEGLSGKSIPLYARIIAIADAYHAMISDRPYRKALTQEEAFNELRKCKGTQFDPELVEPFIEAVKEYELRR